MLKLARAVTPEALRGRLLALRERVRRKALALEAKYQKRRFPLDKARQEFQRNLDHLRSLQAEGRFPAPLLEQALLREMLRIEHVEQELARMDTEFRQKVAALWASARHKAAVWAARGNVAIDLEDLFPEVEHGSSAQL